MANLDDPSREGVLGILPWLVLVSVVKLVYEPAQVTIDTFHIVKVYLVEDFDELRILFLAQFVLACLVQKPLLVANLSLNSESLFHIWKIVST